MLSWVRNMIETQLNIQMRQCVLRGNIGEWADLRIEGRQAVKVLRWMYIGASTFLTRKHVKFLEIQEKTRF